MRNTGGAALAMFVGGAPGVVAMLLVKQIKA